MLKKGRSTSTSRLFMLVFETSVCIPAWTCTMAFPLQQLPLCQAFVGYPPPDSFPTPCPSPLLGWLRSTQSALHPFAMSNGWAACHAQSWLYSCTWHLRSFPHSDPIPTGFLHPWCMPVQMRVDIHCFEFLYWPLSPFLEVIQRMGSGVALTCL